METILKTERGCPLCGSGSADITPYGSSQWPIVTCCECGFVYMRLVPDISRLTSELAWEKTSAAETVRKIQVSPRLKKLSGRYQKLRKRIFKSDKLNYLLHKHLSGGRLLDIGCASGNFLRHLPPNFETYGIEMSENLAQIAADNIKERAGHIIQASAIDGLNKMASDFFDVIIMSAFLEHESQPSILMESVYKALKPKGLVIIKVPNYGCILRRIQGPKWCGFRLPDHVNYFTPATLRQLCEAKKFKVKRFGQRDHLFLSDNMWMVLEK